MREKFLNMKITRSDVSIHHVQPSFNLWLEMEIPVKRLLKKICKILLFMGWVDWTEWGSNKQILFAIAIAGKVKSKNYASEKLFHFSFLLELVNLINSRSRNNETSDFSLIYFPVCLLSWSYSCVFVAFVVAASFIFAGGKWWNDRKEKLYVTFMQIMRESHE